VRAFPERASELRLAKTACCGRAADRSNSIREDIVMSATNLGIVFVLGLLALTTQYVLSAHDGRRPYTAAVSATAPISPQEITRTAAPMPDSRYDIVP
jgi:hypothetical protein